jgi:hypothetical protein
VFLVPALALALFFAFLPRSGSKTVSASTDDREFFASLKPQSSQAVRFAVSPPLSQVAGRQPAAQKFSLIQARPETKNEIPSREIPGAVHDADGSPAKVLTDPMPAPLLSFDGMNNIDNGMAHGILVIPPDVNGDIGPNHYVQSMNILLRVFDKSGNALTPPFKMSSLFSSLGTPCAARDDGEPTVLYDPLADRWLLSQYCNLSPPFRQMVAVSQTGDPMGSYYVYEFLMPNFKLNDVSKLGVWSNAYYMSTDQFLGSDYAGAGAFAFDRDRMLRGDPAAGFIYFDIPSTSGTTRLGGILPADIDGLNPPPANVSGLFMGYLATEYGNAQDALRIFEMRPDFRQPLQSTFSELATSPVPVAAFDPTSPEGRADIAQPAPGEMLDANSDKLMYRVAYRNFGTRESLVVNQTVRTTPYDQNFHCGVRFYELSRPTPTSAFTVNEQNTLSGPGENRWIGSAAEDHQGNLAVGYNTGNIVKKPSIFYTGRAATDPPGTVRTEAALIEGTGVQTAFGFRWGDYSNMAVDPSDDCTFWFTGEYFTQESQDQTPFGWKTRIGKFKFPECAAAPRGTIQGQVTNALSGLPVPNVIIEANTVNTRAANAQGNYSFLLLPGNYSVKVSAHGFIPQTVPVNLANGALIIQNFALQPIPVLEDGGIDPTAESCAVNGAIEPGETVTINLPLRNTGAVNMSNVTVTLQAGGGVTNASGPQNYGALPAGGGFVVRSFTFTASPFLSCGGNISLSFLFQDGAQIAGSFSLSRATGAPRYVMNENFVGPSPDLPAGWTTSASGEQEPWQKVLFEPTQNDYVAFSPEIIHPGINELVSPAVQVTNANATLSFRNRYDLESTFLRNLLYDGGVLEIKIGSGDFQDILAAGGQFISGGYDGPIASCCSNPLAGRLAWSSKSGINTDPAWIISQVRLPAAAAGQNVQLRWRVATDVGGHRTGQWIDNITVQDGVSCSCQAPQAKPPFDFDGDGRSDASTFQANDNPQIDDFHALRSSNNVVQTASWGAAGDQAAVADYDGDGQADYAVFRPTTNVWYILRSSDGTAAIATFGASGDKTTPADFDGDGKADIAVFRPATGVWYVMKSSNGQFLIAQFGLNGDVPVPADYDGDGKADIAVWRPGNGTWYVQRSLDGGFNIAAFGLSGDKPVAGDFDGDGKADYVVFRPAEGNWYLLKSTQGFSAVNFGLSGDRPLQGDFDGDGKRDVAVYRPGSSIWYYLKSSDGGFAVIPFGAGGDTAVPSIYVP